MLHFLGQLTKLTREFVNCVLHHEILTSNKCWLLTDFTKFSIKTKFFGKYSHSPNRPNDVYCALRMRHSVEMISVKSSYDIRNGTFSLDASAIKHLFCLPTDQRASSEKFYHHTSCHHISCHEIFYFQFNDSQVSLALKGVLFINNT